VFAVLEENSSNSPSPISASKYGFITYLFAEAWNNRFDRGVGCGAFLGLWTREQDIHIDCEDLERSRSSLTIREDIVVC